MGSGLPTGYPRKPLGAMYSLAGGCGAIVVCGLQFRSLPGYGSEDVEGTEESEEVLEEGLEEGIGLMCQA